MSLTLFTVTILIRLCLTDGVLGITKEFRAETAETFGTSDDALPALAAGWAVGCSWHISVFLNGRLFSHLPQSRPFGPDFLLIDRREGCVEAARDASGWRGRRRFLLTRQKEEKPLRLSSLRRKRGLPYPDCVSASGFSL